MDDIMNEIEMMASPILEEALKEKVAMEAFLESMPEKLLYFGYKVLAALIIFIIGTQIIRVVRKLVIKFLDRGKIEKGTVQFIASLVRAALYVVLVMMIAVEFGVNAASVAAILGSAGVAVSLAVQGSLSNFAGGLLIMVLKPFLVGDYIKEDVNGNEGTVVEIELFYTKLQTVDNRLIILPNGTLANNSLTNVTACEHRRMDIQVGISYESNIKAAKAVLQRVLDEDEKVIKDKEHFVYVDELGGSAVRIGIRCWFLKEDFWDGKWRITEEVKYALDEAGISIPYQQIEVRINGAENHVEKRVE